MVQKEVDTIHLRIQFHATKVKCYYKLNKIGFLCRNK